ncbi:hypothetical protein XM25_07785 [Devosia sp. H5989]|nr:hypothetical protein XM25_07785 [Devosia sp. H5989]
MSVTFSYADESIPAWALKAAAEDPGFDRPRGWKWVHEWQGHVGEHVRRQWYRIPLELKAAIIADAQGQADAEDWD